MSFLWEKLVYLDSVWGVRLYIVCHVFSPAANISNVAHLLPSASLIDSGSSVFLVSGRRKQRAPKMIVMLLNTAVGMALWYVAKILSNGDTKPPNLLIMETKPRAVCLKEKHVRVQMCTARGL